MIYKTVEDIYQDFHTQTFYATNEVHPKKIVNFEEIKARPEWVYFEKFKEVIDRSHGMLDGCLFIEALTKFYGERFDPANLLKLKSIKIYKNYVLERNLEKDPKNCIPYILFSVNSVVDKCVDLNLKTLDEYFAYGKDLMPLLVKDLSNGLVTYSFLMSIPNLEKLMLSYPLDVRRDYFSEFIKFYDLNKDTFSANETIQKIRTNLTNIIHNKINLKIKKEAS